MEGVGFEPTKAEPSDLQSDPFGRSGTPPKTEPWILLYSTAYVNKMLIFFIKIFNPASNRFSTVKEGRHPHLLAPLSMQEN